MRRLAQCYDARYEYFCLRALGMPLADSQARRFQEPAPDILQRLSDGTGVPVEQLEQMTWRHVWIRLMDEMRRITVTPEGCAEFERFSGQRLSQNS